MMKEMRQNGFSLIQLMIVLVMISVISTAIWNLHIHRMESSYDGYRQGTSEDAVKLALEDIKYHIGLAGYDLENRQKPLRIIKGETNDKLIVRHNKVSFEFYVDRDSNLVKKVENIEKIIAKNISSLNATRMNGNSIAISLSTVTTEEHENDKTETLSKSYSTVAEIRSFL
jgi:hypothetical protein